MPNPEERYYKETFMIPGKDYLVVDMIDKINIELTDNFAEYINKKIKGNIKVTEDKRCIVAHNEKDIRYLKDNLANELDKFLDEKK